MMNRRNREKSGKGWLKAELHSHCSLDPADYRLCPQSPKQLIAEAARLKYDVLAITCHNLDIWTTELAEFANRLGITLIPGMEVSTETTRHTLVYNFRTGAENLDTIEKIRSRRRQDTLVVAPHPYFPTNKCLRKLLDRNLDVFDAIERSAFYASGMDFNRKAMALAETHAKPVVGNGDVHMLWQLGRTFSWVFAEPELTSILEAIKLGRVRVESQPLAHWEIARWWSTALWRTIFPLRSAPSRGPIPDLGFRTAD